MLIKEIQKNSNPLSNTEVAVFAVATLFFLWVKLLGSSLITTACLLALFAVTILVCGTESAIILYEYMVFFAPLTYNSGYLPVAYISIPLGLWTFVELLVLRKGVLPIRYLMWLLIAAVVVARSTFLGEGASSWSFLLNLCIVLYMKEEIHIDSTSRLWKRFLYVLFIAAIVSCFIGLLGYRGDSRFSLPIGTDRACLLLVSGMIYPIFYIENKAVKGTTLLLFALFLCMTLSMTAIVCLGVFAFIAYIAFLLRRDVATKKKYIVFCCGIVAIALGLIAWNFGTGISVIDSIIARAKLTVNYVSEGDFDRATTGRTEIMRYYQAVHDNFSTFEKWFGGGLTSYTSYVYRGYCSHNSYLDALYMLGYIPFAVVLFEILRAFYMDRKSAHFIEDILLKSIFFVTGLTVSISTASYWLLFLFI